jgi:hypothetical protein
MVHLLRASAAQKLARIAPGATRRTSRGYLHIAHRALEARPGARRLLTTAHLTHGASTVVDQRAASALPRHVCLACAHGRHRSCRSWLSEVTLLGAVRLCEARLATWALGSSVSCCCRCRCRHGRRVRTRRRRRHTIVVRAQREVDNAAAAGAGTISGGGGGGGNDADADSSSACCRDGRCRGRRGRHGGGALVAVLRRWIVCSVELGAAPTG